MFGLPCWLDIILVQSGVLSGVQCVPGQLKPDSLIQIKSSQELDSLLWDALMGKYISSGTISLHVRPKSPQRPKSLSY